MNSAEAQKTSSYEQYESPTPPNIKEGGLKFETAEQLKDLKKEVGNNIDQQTTEVVTSSDQNLEKSLTSIDLPKEAIDAARTETGLDKKLKTNEEEIQQLNQDTKNKIDELTGEPTESKPNRKERITNPEAQAQIEANSEQFRKDLTAFKEKITASHAKYKSGEQPSDSEIESLFYENQKLAGILVYGTQRSKTLEHFRDTEDINQDAAAQSETIHKEKLNKFSPEYYDTLAKTGTNTEWVKSNNESRAEAAKAQKYKQVRDSALGSQEASLYAIGVKQEDIDVFLSNQDSLYNMAKENNISQELLREPLTEHDFEQSRYRAYFEARRTGENVFTHVTSPDKLEKIIQGKGLKSSSLTTDKNLNPNDYSAMGQTGNIEENVYFTSGGGGYQYGSKIERGKIMPKSVEDFVFFATTGKDIMASGKSIEVARPSLYEQNESQRGRAVGDFESADGAEIPLENMYVVAPTSQMIKYIKLFKEQGYDSAWATKHVINIPDSVVKLAIEEGGGNIKRNSEAIQQFVDSKLKQSLNKRSPNKDKVFATTTGRTSTDAVAGNENTVFKWQQIN